MRTNAKRLLEVKGVSQRLARQIARAYPELADLRDAPVEELAAIPYVSPRIATEVKTLAGERLEAAAPAIEAPQVVSEMQTPEPAPEPELELLTHPGELRGRAFIGTGEQTGPEDHPPMLIG